MSSDRAKRNEALPLADARIATDESATTAVIRAVATGADADPVDLPPLYHSIDTDALNDLVAAGFTGELSFEYRGYTVVVDGDGVVTVHEGPTIR